MKYFYKTIVVLFFFEPAFSQKDSISVKVPKHYFNTILLWDYYQKPKVNLNGTDYVSEKIKSYQIQQSIFTFNIPIFTKDILKKDSSLANFNLLLTGYFLNFNPNFEGLQEKHILVKNGLGIRLVYNNGRRSIFFADFSPFVTKDKGYDETRVARMASLLLWSWSVSEKFNFRLGLTKSFMWGNRYYLPFIGFRIGRLDKINFSFQFPRIISFNFPIRNKFQLSWFTKPMGGLFSISNKDTLYPAFFDKNKTVYLGRYEFLSGIRIDFKPLKYLGIYFSIGRTINNYLALYSLQFNKNQQFSYGHFFQNQPGRSSFINFGIVAYLGKTKSYYQRKNIDEQIQLNNQMGVGDENLQVFQPTDNYSKQKKFKADNQEISDLINSFDY